jgi:hypothetical protein
VTEEESRRYSHVTNQEITVHPSVINSVVLDHATERGEGTIFLSLFRLSSSSFQTWLP